MQDSDFLFQFEQCSLPKELFNQRGHLRVAYLYLNKYSFEEASAHIVAGIKHYATSLGALHIYHETLTRSWISLVYKAMSNCHFSSYDTFIEKNNYLLDKNLMLEYYSQAVLDSPLARQEWLAPDIKAILE